MLSKIPIFISGRVSILAATFLFHSTSKGFTVKSAQKHTTPFSCALFKIFSVSDRVFARDEQQPKTVFVNHGDDDAVIAFQALLKEMGYQAEAPYSGTEYDLLTGRMTIYTDSVPVKRTAPQQDSRAKQVYNELLAAAEALLKLVKGRKGRTNKDNAKLTSQIRSLIDKWKD